VVEAFHGESDRAAAVFAGSFIESYLAKYLLSHMVDDPCVQDLFDGFGPFASYKQRVDSAYAFGFIQKEQRTDLTLIGKVRNHFAHHPLEAAFDKAPVSGWCTNLSTNKLYPLTEQPPDLKRDNRYRYLVAIGKSIVNWHNKMLGFKDSNYA